MLNQSGLSLDQAPPIDIVFRFFFVGSLFGVLAGILLFFYQTDIFDASTSAAKTFTHVFTLGIMLSFMLAALFQMLPVIAGVTLKTSITKINYLLPFFTLGILILLLGFNFTSHAWLFVLSGVLLSILLLSIVMPMFIQLLKIPHHTSSSKGMGIALLSLSLVILLALYLVGAYVGLFESNLYLQFKTAHYSFGLFGWIALLIISISFQVIEMFYVTPPYPDIISKYLPLTLFILLFSSSILSLFIQNIWIFSNTLLGVLLSTYALITLKRLAQKKRPLSDATVWFWRLGLVSLIISMFFTSLGLFTNIHTSKPLSYIFFASFSLSIAFAMFYKIIPFLTWFHLNSQGYFTAPLMHEIIHPQTAKKHLYIHLATIVAYVLSLFVSAFIFVAAMLTIVSFSWMAYQVIHADRLYKETQKSGEKFEMGDMG